MKKCRFLILCSLVFFVVATTFAKTSFFPKEKIKKERKSPFVQDCVLPQSKTDLKINNIRARLKGGGDMWFDANALGYTMQVKAGKVGVSMLFAAGLWAGGLDNGGNIKMACSTYRTQGNDWFSGPLNTKEGTTTADVCKNWDRHFVVLKSELEQAKAIYKNAAKDANGVMIDTNLIHQFPKNILGWPALGNPFFKSIHGFDLPLNQDYLASFWNLKATGKYNPLAGDLPHLGSCSDTNNQPDQIIFWLFNDEGNAAKHSNSKGNAMKMEGHATAFAYQSDENEVNNTVFQRYRLIYRGAEALDSFSLGIWADPHLGCGEKDLIGFDHSLNQLTGKPRAMMYVYNKDENNAIGQCSGFENEPPMLGFDLIQNIKNGSQDAPVSFMYYNSSSVDSGVPASTDPETTQEFYRYLNSVWKDGTPLTRRGSGYNLPYDQKEITKFAFDSAPNDAKGWSMKNMNLPKGDYRMLMKMGAFNLASGRIMDMTYSIPAVANQGGGAIDLTRLRMAADDARKAFDKMWRSCSDDITILSPDAPDIQVVTNEKNIILTLTNNNPESNNYLENYDVKQFEPEDAVYFDLPKSYYKLEGYKIFQLSGDFEYSENIEKDSSKVRLVAQTDINNNISKITNWNSKFDADKVAELRYFPTEKVDGTNEGLKHSFIIKTDAFAKNTDNQLVVGKKYYFTAVAYAHNDFKTFDKKTGLGQRNAYLQSERRIKTYDVKVEAKTNPSAYQLGDLLPITRFDGVGIGNHFVEMQDSMLQQILDGKFNGAIGYKAGKSPIEVKVIEPLSLKEGDYELSFFDAKMTDNIVENDARWKLKNLNTATEIISDKSIETWNEQLIPQWGLSINIGQTKEPATDPINIANNGAIGGTITYKDATKPKWFAAITNVDTGSFNFIEKNPSFDPNNKFSTSFVNGQFVPYALCSYRPKDSAFISPAWHNTKNNNYFSKKLINLNNIDLVFTSDKSKWSRCPVVETGNKMYSDAGLLPKDNTANMSLRTDLSIGSDTNPDAASDGTTGKSWFPGYAIDVETGQRLMVFFGENSGYDLIENPLLSLVYNITQTPTGGDMIWNPTQDVLLTNQNVGGTITAANLIAGCNHYIYVTDLPYTEWKTVYDGMTSSPLLQHLLVKNIRWTSMPLLQKDTKLLSYKDGLIPNECSIKLRVANPYQVAKGVGTNNFYPTYRFKVNAKGMIAVKENQLQDIDNQQLGVYPNPVAALSNFVTIQGVQGQTEAIIYNQEGRVVRHFTKLELASSELQWNLTTDQGSKVPSGIYFIVLKTKYGWKSGKLVVL